MDKTSSSTRVTRCVVAAAVLSGICFVYVNLSSLMLDVDHSDTRTHLRRSPPEPMGSVADESVFKWFPQDAWVRSATGNARYGRQYLFYNTMTTLENPVADDSEDPRVWIELKPIAIFFKNEDPGAKPVFATADSAVLTLSERFSLQDSTIGHIERMSLENDVVIQGPSGMYITGHQFHAYDESVKLTSRQPIQFEFDGHQGQASHGVEIQLKKKSHDDKGLTSVTGMQLVRLYGAVDCELNFDGGRHRTPTHLKILAPSGFDFDPRQNIGIFRGKLGGEDNPTNDVLVERQTDGEPDQLRCTELRVVFHRKIEPETGKAKASRLRLDTVTATGSARREIDYWSPDHGVRARMTRLNYRVGANRIDMFGTPADRQSLTADRTRSSTKDKTQFVRIVQEGRQLFVPHLRILHGDGNGIERIECRGRGFVTQAESPAHESLENSGPWKVDGAIQWKQQLNVQRGVDGITRTVSIQGAGLMSLPERQMKLKAQENISVTLQSPHASTEPGTTGALPEFSLSMTETQPKQLIARGDVVIHSPSVSGRLKDQLTVHFHERDSSSDNDVSVISQTQELSSAAANNEGQDRAQTPAIQGHSEFYGSEMTADVILPGDSGTQQAWSSVWLKGDVQVNHRGAEADDRYTAEGNTFIAKNGLGEVADISLFGNPAILKSSTGHVTGARIDLHQADGVAEINGGGELKMIIDQDFDGKQLPSPVPMTVYWTDRMKVEGKKAHFVGGIRIVMDGVRYAVGNEQIHDTEILTPELEVFFVDPVSLSGRQSSGEIVAAVGNASRSPEIDQIQCVGQTTIHRKSFTDGEMDGLLDAEVVNLTIDPGTGDFSAIGPGWMESTSTTSDSNPIRPTNQIRVRANTRTEIRASPFARIRVTFIGQLQGNLTSREAELRNFVKIAYAAVQDLDEQIDLETIPAEQMPEDSRILQAEEIHIMAVPGQDEDGFSITALGDAWLESRDLSGDADRITYDHSKSLIVLTGEEGRLVNGRYRDVGTGRYQNMNGPSFTYNVKTHGLNIQTIYFEGGLAD